MLAWVQFCRITWTSPTWLGTWKPLHHHRPDLAGCVRKRPKRADNPRIHPRRPSDCVGASSRQESRETRPYLFAGLQHTESRIMLVRQRASHGTAAGAVRLARRRATTTTTQVNPTVSSGYTASIMDDCHVRKPWEQELIKAW